MKKMITALLIFMTFAGGAAFAADSLDRKEPSAAEITFDVFILRPIGIAATAAGTGIFIVALPFSLPTGSVKLTARKLVGGPFEFTFMRPLGYDTANY